ncbi:MAG: LPP20 family lipoprotein, partial [Gammaproteobacteria bacterium]
MNAYRLFFVLALLLTTLAACSSNTKPGNAQPDWVSGQSTKYSSSAYLLGRGQSDDPAIARDRARADLAKIFSVKISEQTRDVSSYSNSAGARSQNKLDVSRNISTRTDEILRGVEIADTWQDPVTRQYYALAVLPRFKADAALRQQIADLDASTQAYMNQAQGSNDLFVKIAGATRVVSAQTTRAALQ